MKANTVNNLNKSFLILVIIISITGFWNIYFGPDASPTFYQNLHVITSFTWLGLLLAQFIFISNRRNSMHIRLGKSIFVVAPVLVATLMLLSVHSASKSAARGEADMLVIQNIFPAIEVAILIFLGFLFRKNRKLHGHFLMSTALMFFGIALFFTLISFIPGFKIAGPETFYRFETAAMAATYISVAFGFLLFLIQWRSGWPWLLTCMLFFINGYIGQLLAEADQMIFLTAFIGSINEYAAFFVTLVLVLGVLSLSFSERKSVTIGMFLGILCVISMSSRAQSVYTQTPNDPGAHYFTEASYGINANGKEDVSEALQLAINKLKKERNFGILFIPEGKYRISKTIYVPKAIRIIGYGKNRPEFILKKNTDGFSEEQNYMFWFTSNLVEEGVEPSDASAGTFYSAISNIDFRIEPGNPKAVALRTHFAQHSFVSHCNFYIGEGYAGIYDLGNEIENLKFYGGTYGISSSRTSPGWPMMLIDLYFEGQRNAAILSRNTGMSIISMQVNDVPVAVELQQGIADRLFMEDCLFRNVETGVVVGVENEASSQVNLVNVFCQNVDVPVHFASSGQNIEGKGNRYVIKNFVHGLVMENMEDNSTYRTISELEDMNRVPEKLDKAIPDLPSMDSWINVKELGIAGDGKTDDTRTIQEAIANHESLYFPTGFYRITGTIKLKEGTRLIGLHPYATQFVLNESETNFSGFGAPVPVLESSEGGDDVINGIGISTGAYNNRAVALKWMGSASSMINDVKIVGGHGTMSKPGEPSSRRNRNQNISSPAEPVYERGMDQAWDNQYWSIWVTNNGGGILKDIWTANTYASTGLYISDTSTPGKVYAMSLEHHLRQEARMNNIANWKFYAFQFEEEGREGKDAQTLNINDCNNLMFANFWMYRTIRVNTPRPWGIKVSNSSNIVFRNMRSWTQVLQLPERTIFDMDKNLIVYPGDFARANITGNEMWDRNTDIPVEKIGFGYEFATGATSDSKGNVYFCEHQQKRVYKWSAETNTISIYADYPYKPISLAVDTRDNLLVICRYDPQPGFKDSNQPQTIENLSDNNPYYSGWGNGGWAAVAYAINSDKTDDMQVLPLSRTNGIENVQRVIHPTHRWRDDFEKVVSSMADMSFVAPDGVTIIPNTFDLGRSVQLMAVKPNQSEPVFVTHEDPKVTYQFKVNEYGGLSEMSEFIARGEYGNAYKNDSIYLAEGPIFILDRNGKEIKRIKLDERVQSLTWGGENNNELFVTTSNAFYKVNLNGTED